jgi:AcrR family transcriptional regulator
MQVKKENIKEKIISSARREFLQHGYVKASLRVIAQKEGLTKGAVYSYFKSKDALFCELTAPAIRILEIESQNNKCSYYKAQDNLKNSYEATIQSYKNYAHTVLDNHDSFKLLLFCSAGSSLHNYKERIIQLYAQNFYSHFSMFNQTTCNVSEMFIHMLAATYVNFLEELVLHKPERKEAEQYASQMAIFVHSGIKNLFKHQL